MRYLVATILIGFGLIGFAWAQNTQTFTNYMTGLPLATTPLAGTEPTIILQSGTVKQTPVGNVGGVSSINGTSGQILVSPSTGVPIVSLAPTITSNVGFSGRVIFTGPATFTQQPAFLNNPICYVDGVNFGTLAQALASCSSNHTIVVANNQTVSSNLTVTGSGVHIRCENNVSLTFSASISMAFTAADDSLDNCNLVGPGIGVNTNPPILVQGIRLALRNNVITNFGYTFTQGIISNHLFGNPAGDISGLMIAGNILYNNGDIGVLLSGATPTMVGLRIVQNQIGNGVTIAPGAGLVSASDWVLSNNVLFGGNANGLGALCMELVAGVPPTNSGLVRDVTIVGNTCRYTQVVSAQGAECFGTGAMDKFTIAGNLCDGNGLLGLGGNNYNGIEVNTGTDGTITGNVVVGLAPGGVGKPILCGSCNNVIINGNTVDGFGTADSGILVASASGSSGSIIVANNVVKFPVSGAGTGIFAWCQTGSVTCQNFSIVDNQIISDGTVGSIGVRVSRDAGTVRDFLIGPNLIASPATGVAISATVTNICLVSGLNTAVSPVQNSGAGSLCN